MADANTPVSYRNGEVIWQVNAVYDEIVNNDIWKLPYAKRKSNSWYDIHKRNWYVIDKLASIDVEWWASATRWYTRDVVRQNKSTCVDDEYWYYLYQVSEDWLSFRVIRKDDGAACSITEIDTWFICHCWYERFIELPSVTGIPKVLLWSWATVSTAEISEERWIRLYDDSLILANVNVGDYIIIYDSTISDSQFLAWQIRQVIGKWLVVAPDLSWHTQYLELDHEFADWPATPNILGTNIPGLPSTPEILQFLATWVQYAVFPTYGTTFGYVWIDWIRTIDTTTSIGGLWYSSTWPVCITSVQNFNGTINYLNEFWNNFFWSQSFDIAHFNSENVNVLSLWVIATFVYKNFILWLAKDSIYYIAKLTDGLWNYDQISMKISDVVWVKSKYSYWLYKDSMLMVTNNNRLLSIWVKSDGSSMYLDTQDISDYIRWYLDSMLDTDEVFIHTWNNNLYIFINTRSRLSNSRNDTTKILILNDDYKIRHTHELCDMVISWVKYWYFYWDWFYWYFWEEDVVLRAWVLDPRPISSRISAYIWDNQANELKDSEWNPYRLMRKKKINRLKFLLWVGVYTDWNTIVKLDTYRDWYKFEKVFDTVEWVEWIDNRNNYFKWEEVLPSECFLADLDKCDNVVRECAGAVYNDTWIGSDIDPESNILLMEDPLICTEDLHISYPKKINDFCICYDSRWYALSPTYNVYLHPHSKPADLFKITIYSNWYDRISFMGMIVEFISEDLNSSRVWVNVIWLKCNDDLHSCPADWCAVT